jgi:hypothetical protein
MTATSSSQEKSFFDLHLIGSGRMRRVRDVENENAPAYLACDLFVSPKGSDESVRFDCKVVGKDAHPLVRRCHEADKAGQVVRVGFKLGDLRPGTFTYSEGKRAGERGIRLKTRLLFIYWVTFDGQLIYEAPSKDPGDERPRHIPSMTEPGLSIAGLGYLNRMNWVKSECTENGFFLACGIGALNGRRDKPSYVHFDAHVFDTGTQELVRPFQKAVDAKKKVLIGFELGGLSASIYTPTQGKNAGKPAVDLKSELARLRWVKVDGELVYPKPEPKPEPKPAPKPEPQREPQREEDIPTEIPQIESAEALAA